MNPDMVRTHPGPRCAGRGPRDNAGHFFKWHHVQQMKLFGERETRENAVLGAGCRNIEQSPRTLARQHQSLPAKSASSLRSAWKDM